MEWQNLLEQMLSVMQLLIVINLFLLKTLPPDVSGYTFEKTTIGSNYVNGDVISISQ